jgi:hypothetical protein
LKFVVADNCADPPQCHRLGGSARSEGRAVDTHILEQAFSLFVGKLLLSGGWKKMLNTRKCVGMK